ncbi:MAG: AfsR/SARP family transcriptional regulator, partial [Coriobacteriia bacterium]
WDEHTNDEVRARILITATVLDGLVEGRWDLAARHGRQALALKNVPLACHFQVLGNHSHALLELGDLARSERAAREVMAKSEACGLEEVELVYEFNIAACVAASGDYERARRMADDAIASVEALGETHTACMCQAMWVTCHIAAGDYEGAVCRAEHAYELAMDLQAHHLQADAQIQLAAALLAVNDVPAAARLASQALGQAAVDGSQNLLLAGDLLAYECARRMGTPDCQRPWAAHAQYVATGSMNWRLAMLVRAFPEMMVALVRHGVAEAMPRRCLTFLIPSDWEAVLALSGEYSAAVTALMKRAGVVLPENPLETLHVRMFGGLDVRIGSRTISKREWRKRRARLMLAMLVLEQGNELARDKISEYLWPEVEVEKATNNFYVAWSAMKNAIMPGADKMTKLPYFESSHGLCRAVMTNIESDVTEFSDLITGVRRAHQSSDIGTLQQTCQRLAEVYKGELLPGDLYDDWFAAARDKYRREFGDAMRTGATTLLDAGRPEECVTLLRKGVEADPWREDLYQLLLRAHIASGQRGAAIDVYLSCRHRLAEDLGLDPSAETLRLYEQILAMEEVETGYGSETSEETS